MNPNQAYANSAVPETRTVEQSLLDATESMGRAEYLLERLHAAVTGYEQPPQPTEAGGAAGIMHDAARLASRLQSFCADLERTSARVTAANVQSLGQSGSNSVMGHAVSGRLG